jgi:hypothetical protein
MASLQISCRIEGSGRVRSKLKIETDGGEPLPELNGILLESNLVDSRTHRLRIGFGEALTSARTEPGLTASRPASDGFWAKIRARFGALGRKK